MTENDEGAVRYPVTTVSWDLYQAVCDGLSKANMERDRAIEGRDLAVNELRQARIDLREQAANAAGAHEDMTSACLEAVADRDQALTRLGEAEKLLAEAMPYIPMDWGNSTKLSKRISEFLARDSAGGMGGGET
jgi:hypothetical protein